MVEGPARSFPGLVQDGTVRFAFNAALLIGLMLGVIILGCAFLRSLVSDNPHNRSR
jgi:hypothetical protein